MRIVAGKYKGRTLNQFDGQKIRPTLDMVRESLFNIIQNKKEKEVFKLKYISAGPLETPELSVEQAFNEIIHFAYISKNGMLYAKEALNESDTEKFELLKGKLEKYEEIYHCIVRVRCSRSIGIGTGEGLSVH